MVNSYSRFREKQERKAKERRKRIERARIRRLAREAQSLPQPYTEPSLTPFIPSERQAEFEAQRTAQTTARTPFGGEVSIGAPEGAREQRRKPEFGSWWGSGITEGLAGTGIGALLNLQKGIETFGGVSTATATRLTPGEQPFERNVREILEEEKYKDRYAATDLAGQAQVLAEAFRRTDMPAWVLDLPGEGIKLPGGRTLNEIDIGVKGLIELIPDALFTIATLGGGAGLVGVKAGATGAAKGIKAGAKGAIIGTAKTAGTIGYRTLGLDIPVGGAKALSKRIRRVSGPDEIRAFTHPSKKMVADTSFTTERTDRMTIAEVRQAVNRLPSGLKGAISGIMSAISPAILIDATGKSKSFVDKLNRAVLGRLNSYSLIAGSVEINLATFVNKLETAGLGGLDAVPQSPKTLDIGERIGHILGKAKRTITGQEEQKSIFNVDDRGIIIMSDVEAVNGKVYVNVMQDFFKNDFDTIRKADEGGYIKNTSAIRIERADDGSFKRFVIKRDGKFTETAETRLATFMRIYLEDGIGGMVKHYEHHAGHLVAQRVEELAKMRFIDGKYAPQVPRYSGEGGETVNFFDELNGMAGSLLPGDKRRQWKSRSYWGDNLQEAVEKGNMAYVGPMEAMQIFHTGMYGDVIDIGFTKFLATMDPKNVLDVAKIQKTAKNLVDRNLNSGNYNAIREGFKKIKLNSLTSMVDEIETSIDPARVQKLKDELHNNVNAIAKLNERIQETGEYISANSMFGKPKGVKRVPPAFLGMMFKNTEDIESATKKTIKSIVEERGVESGFRANVAKVGDLFRLGKTGFDFGFALIHGVPTYGFIAGRFLSGKAGIGETAVLLKKTLIDSQWRAAQAFVNPKKLMQVYLENPDIVREFVEKGGQVSRAAQDVFTAIDNATVLKNIPKVGESLDGILTSLAKPFERGFVAPGDFIRIELYKAMRSTAMKSEHGLEEAAGMINKMTGALSSSSFGVSRRQQQIERGWLFFSPRYTRSAMALLTDVYRGGLRGEMARQSVIGMLGTGALAYAGFCAALKQKPNFDPTDSGFMSVQVGGDRVGIGTFYTQFLRLAAKIAATSYDDDAREAFVGSDGTGFVKRINRNPLVSWIRGRSSPIGSIAWTQAVGSDYMGREINGSLLERLENTSRSLTPIWAEGALLERPYRTGGIATTTEVFGGRVRPLSAYERRRDLRDTLGVAAYGKKWKELNQGARKKIENGEVKGVSAGDVLSLEELTQAHRAQLPERGGREEAIEGYYAVRDEIEEELQENIGQGLDHLNAGVIDFEIFRRNYLQPAYAINRKKMEELHDETGEHAGVHQYFHTMAKKFGNEHVEDLAYQEYVSEVIATDAFDDPTGFNYRKKDAVVKAFRDKWGDEVYAYVQEIFKTGSGIPDQVQELWEGKKRFNYYFKDVDELTIASLPRSAEIKSLYERWLELTKNQQYELEQENPLLKTFFNKRKAVKIQLRKQDRLLDAWLFRFGYTNTLLHPENQLSPDGLDDARIYWRMPELGSNGDWRQIWNIPSGQFMG